MTDQMENSLDPEEIILTGSAAHGFGEEDFEEESTLDEEEDEEDEDEQTVEDG